MSNYDKPTVLIRPKHYRTILTRNLWLKMTGRDVVMYIYLLVGTGDKTKAYESLARIRRDRVS